MAQKMAISRTEIDMFARQKRARHISPREQNAITQKKNMPDLSDAQDLLRL
ncbi:hypothetical protein AA3271_2542 [Gluconobacter japonicus NBRC 3271]|nr:hypothetical protein AA3271_2542 [Gluconobacter japonicus NBRC 3271]